MTYIQGQCWKQDLRHRSLLLLSGTHTWKLHTGTRYRLEQGLENGETIFPLLVGGDDQKDPLLRLISWDSHLLSPYR